MQKQDFFYDLPPDRIAHAPVEPRDSSRLLCVNRTAGEETHGIFRDIVSHLRSGDVIVRNVSKVFRARLTGMLHTSDGAPLLNRTKPVEIFLVRETENTGVWRVLGKPGKHILPGLRVVFAPDFFCDVLVKEPDGSILVQFPYDADTVRMQANQHGSVPLPPYIKDERHALETYQTVYAKTEGSVAAPTAGFHFTDTLIADIESRGVVFVDVCLHVGLGTFLPMTSERVEDHTMHAEWVEITPEAAEQITSAKARGQRILALGTTTVRTLEGVAELFGSVVPYKGDLQTFITPGFPFRVVDGMITNFHLPCSTLFMLVCAFLGDTERMRAIYADAVARQYRFYSFGDAMFIA